MDDTDDFQALFFIECDTNLEDLQSRLNSLLSGDIDPEVVNAAFRMVHSVKGGAAAFGFKSLVDFAHEFETVMDRLRSGAISLSAALQDAAARSGRDDRTGRSGASRHRRSDFANRGDHWPVARLSGK